MELLLLLHWSHLGEPGGALPKILWTSTVSANRQESFFPGGVKSLCKTTLSSDIHHVQRMANFSCGVQVWSLPGDRGRCARLHHTTSCTAGLNSLGPEQTVVTLLKPVCSHPLPLPSSSFLLCHTASLLALIHSALNPPHIPSSVIGRYQCL